MADRVLVLNNATPKYQSHQHHGRVVLVDNSNTSNQQAITNVGGGGNNGVVGVVADCTVANNPQFRFVRMANVNVNEVGIPPGTAVLQSHPVQFQLKMADPMNTLSELKHKKKNVFFFLCKFTH